MKNDEHEDSLARGRSLTGESATGSPRSPQWGSVLTVDDIDQIVEGMNHFIISGDPDVEAVWQPYLDKLAALRAELLVLDTARDILDASICECSHIDSDHAFANSESNDVADCHGNDLPGFGNCGCKEFRPVSFVVARAPAPAVAASDPQAGSTGNPASARINDLSPEVIR